MSPQDTHNNTQQDQGDKTPKYPSPRLMTVAVDRRFFGFLTHGAAAISIVSTSIGSLSSARALFIGFDIGHFSSRSLDARFDNPITNPRSQGS
jgi:hypothetical protein